MKSFEKFELLTKTIYEKLNRSGYSVEHNVKLPGKDGLRQIDVLIEGKLGPSAVRMIVECKDYKGRINVTKVDELDSKMKDVNAHVGILVSAKGFSKTAIKKAKRLGIRLYTAHEALSEKWKIDLDLPVVIKEITPALNIHYKVQLEKGQSFSNELLLNDIDIFNAFYKMWNSKKFKTEINQENVLELIGINAPYFMRDINTKEKIDIEAVNIGLSFAGKFYFGNLSELKNTLLLKDITEDKTEIIFEAEQLLGYKDKFAPYDREDDIPKRDAVVIQCAAYPIINGANSGFLIKPENKGTLEVSKYKDNKVLNSWTV